MFVTMQTINPQPNSSDFYEQVHMMSYEKLYNSADCLSDEYNDNRIWRSSIVINTDYADETIPFEFYDQEQLD